MSSSTILQFSSISDASSLSPSTTPFLATNPTGNACLQIKVPVANNAEEVDGVALGVSAAVGLVVGAIIALIVAWLVFRYFFSKTEQKVSPEKSANAEKNKTTNGAAKDAWIDKTNDFKATSSPGVLRSILLQNSSTDDCTQHGLLDLLSLTKQSDVTMETGRQKVEAIRQLELDNIELRINMLMLLVRALLNQLLANKAISQCQLDDYLTAANETAQNVVKTCQQNQKVAQEELRKTVTKDADRLDWELKCLQQKYMFLLSSSLSSEVKKNLRENLLKTCELSEDDIDAAMRHLTDTVTRLENKMAVDLATSLQSLQESSQQQQSFMDCQLTSSADRSAQCDDRTSVLVGLLSSVDGKLSDKLQQNVIQQYSTDLRTLRLRIEQELQKQTATTISKLRECRAEKLSAFYESRSKQIADFFVEADRVKNLKEIYEAFTELTSTLRSERNDLCDSLDQREAKMFDAVNKGLDELWFKELELIDSKMKESLRTKAQLTSVELDELSQLFTVKLIQMQRIRQMERQETLRTLQEMHAADLQAFDDEHHRELEQQKSLRVSQDVLLKHVLNAQIGLSNDARKTILKFHEEGLTAVINQLQLSRLYWNKLHRHRLHLKEKHLLDARVQLSQLTAALDTVATEGGTKSKTDNKNAKSQQKQKLQLEKLLKDEEPKFAKFEAEEQQRLASQLDSDATDSLKSLEQQMTRVIGRLLARQARKQATPSVHQDATTTRLQEHVLKAICAHAGEVRLSESALDSVVQQYHSEVSTLMDQLHGARDRQLRTINDKLEHDKQLRDREIQMRLKAEADRDWKLQKQQSHSGLLTQLSREFFEQRYQSELDDLESEMSAEKERSKNELCEELDVELQKQLKVRKMFFYAGLIAAAQLDNDDIADIVKIAVQESGGDDRQAARLSKELRQEALKARTDLDQNRTSNKHPRWPKTDADYMASRPQSRSGSRGSLTSQLRSDDDDEDNFVQSRPRSRSEDRSRNDDQDRRLKLEQVGGKYGGKSGVYPLPGSVQYNTNDDVQLMQQRRLRESMHTADQLRRAKTDLMRSHNSGSDLMQTYPGVHSGRNDQDVLRREKTDVPRDRRWNYPDDNNSDYDSPPMTRTVRKPAWGGGTRPHEV